MLANARLLAGTLLNGEVYSAEFLPGGGAPFAFAGLVAIGSPRRAQQARLARGARDRTRARDLRPCAYYTFLWNRLRYLWPFATGWLIGLACLAKLAADALAWLRAPHAARRRAARVRGRRRDAAHEDGWDDRRRGAIGERDRPPAGRARAVGEGGPPASARIGLNDTGAIAYFGDRRTFDVVGLTTRSEGRYWVAGAGSRLEHYERLHATNPSALPTHFIVYPEWFKIDALLGEELHEATVTDATILGGGTMRAHLADYRSSDRGSSVGADRDDRRCAGRRRPRERGGARYELLGARDGDRDRARPASRPTVTRSWTAGGRCGPTSASSRIFVRERGRAPSSASRPRCRRAVHVRVGGREVALFEVEPAAWTEAIFNVPAESAGPETAIELVTERAALTVFHYWFGATP